MGSLDSSKWCVWTRRISCDGLDLLHFRRRLRCFLGVGFLRWFGEYSTRPTFRTSGGGGGGGGGSAGKALRSCLFTAVAVAAALARLGSHFCVPRLLCAHALT